MPASGGASVVAGAPTASGVSSPSVGSAATQLDVALQPLRTASMFETTVTVDGVVVVRAKGRTLGDASQTTVTTAGKSVDYIEIPPRAWARHGTGPWVLVAGNAAPTAPLQVLATPLTLVAATSGTPGTFTATYPANALGLAGGPLTVTVSIAGDALTFRYEATTSGHPTSSTTTLLPGPVDTIKAP